jgi:CheY-like chemotaxis protein
LIVVHETAHDGVTALERARQSPPDVVVTDSLRPGLDGFGLLEALEQALKRRESR